jgi:hypothetical protein
MNNIFNNSRVLTREVQDFAVNSNLTARPFNRFKPNDTIWWLVPSTDWPAYEYGKLFFESRKERMFCGYNLEKGVGIGNDVYHHSLLIKRDWVWNEFIANLRKNNKNLLSILKYLESRELETCIVISASLVPTDNAQSFGSADSFLEQKAEFQSTQIEFGINGDLSLSHKSIEANDIQRNIADYFKSELLEESDISKLASKISEANFPDSDWSWIDFYIGVYLSNTQKKVQTVAKLWEDYLEPWEPWLRKAHLTSG